MFGLPQNNDMVNVSDLVRLNDAIRKATPGFVGYQTPAQMGDGSLSPLALQSIEPNLAIATFQTKHLTLWQKLAKTTANNFVHEYTSVIENGLDSSPFISEGQGGSDTLSTNQSVYERKFVKIKFMAERRQVSDMASMLSLLGGNSTALAEETERGTLTLLKKMEKALWFGDEDVNPDGFDGLIKQIERTSGAIVDGQGRPYRSNTWDLEGSAPTILLLQEILGAVYSSPNFGEPDTIYVTPNVYAELQKQFNEQGRYDISVSGNSIVAGVKSITVMAPYGPVEIVSAPFLERSEKPNSIELAGHGISASFGTQPTAANDTTNKSKFKAGDAGYYKYAVVAVNKLGMTLPIVSDAVQIASGDKVSMKITRTGNPAISYRLYRTAKASSSAAVNTDTLKFIMEVSASQLEGNSFADFNHFMYGCSHIIFANHDPGQMAFAKLMDFMRKDLAQVSTTKPFLLMLFGSLMVKTPNKFWVVRNAGTNNASGVAANYLNANF
jgi:hypothetical protein